MGFSVRNLVSPKSPTLREAFSHGSSRSIHPSAPTESTPCRSNEDAMAMKPEVVVIAGFDSSGGAGLTVDGETVRFLGATPRFVVTALTAQTDEVG